jgi:hypothetical protein
VHQVPPVARRLAQVVQEPGRPAIDAPREVYLHFHGINPAEVAAIIKGAKWSE